MDSKILAAMSTVCLVKMIDNDVWDSKIFIDLSQARRNCQCTLEDAKLLLDWTRSLGADYFKSLAQYMQDHAITRRTLGEIKEIDGGEQRALRMEAVFKPQTRHLLVVTWIEQM